MQVPAPVAPEELELGSVCELSLWSETLVLGSPCNNHLHGKDACRTTVLQSVCVVTVRLFPVKDQSSISPGASISGADSRWGGRGHHGRSPVLCRMQEHLFGCISASGASSTGPGVAWAAVPRLSWCQRHQSQQQPTSRALDYVAQEAGWLQGLQGALPRRTPAQGGHLVKEDTFPSRTPAPGGHLLKGDTCSRGTPSQAGHLPKQDTAAWEISTVVLHELPTSLLHTES